MAKRSRTPLTLPQGAFGDLPDATESNKGQIYYASDQDSIYYSNGSEWVSFEGGGNITLPHLSSISPSQIEPLSSTEITINGQNFEDGCVVDFGETRSSAVTFVDSGTLTADTGDTINSGVYDVKVTNPSNLGGILLESLIVDGTPVWNTEPGSLGLVVDSSTGDHFALDVTDPEGQQLTYSVVQNSLPDGLSLEPNTGVIFGDPVDVVDDINYEFNIQVADTANTPNISDRSFSILITHQQPGVEFSGQFNSGSSNQHCGEWNTFRGNLTGTYNSITLSGSNDPTGVTCNGSEANNICQALRAGSAGSWSCDGRTWRIGNCGSGVEINASTSICNCVNSYTVRPCIGNTNWGGINTSSCSSPT